MRSWIINKIDGDFQMFLRSFLGKKRARKVTIGAEYFSISAFGRDILGG